MKRIIKYLAPISFIAVALCGCRKEGLGESYDITFSTQTAGMTKDAGQYTGSDLSTLGSFTVTGYDGSTKLIDDKTVNYTGGQWELNDTPKAWQEGHTLTFWAYANMPTWAGASVSGSSSMSLTISSMPTTAASQWDPMYGYYSGTGNKGNASIRFYHPLTAVSFRTGSLGEAKYNVTGITGVTVKNVYKSGTATISGATTPTVSWSPGLDMIDAAGSFTGTGTSGHSAVPFLLIPQDLGSKNVLLEVEVSRSSGGPKTMYATIKSGSWEAGKVNVYTLDYVNNQMEATLTVTLEDWGAVANTYAGTDWFNAKFD